LWNGFNFYCFYFLDRINRIIRFFSPAARVLSAEDRFIRLRPNTLQLAAGMKGKVNRAVARQSEGGFGFGAIPL
jgi:hypothetical protein